MSRKSEWARRRYAEDPEFRKRKAASSRRYRKAHGPRINEQRRRRRADPEIRSKALAGRAMADLKRRLARYGLSVEEYEALVREQNGACAICKKKPPRWFCIDHCHSTGVVRGLLCVKCNVGLGHFDEDPHLMRTATAYLEVFRAPRPPSETPKIFLRVEK